MGFEVRVVSPSTLTKPHKKQRRKSDCSDAEALGLVGAQSPGLLEHVQHISRNRFGSCL